MLGIKGASATDSTFAAPGVSGCGPGGVDNQFVDEALNAWAGLPAASGNTLSLSGQFLLADNYSADGCCGLQDPSANMLAAFQASTSGEHSIKRPITLKHFKHVLHKGG